jgi:hypothetical protein
MKRECQTESGPQSAGLYASTTNSFLMRAVLLAVVHAIDGRLVSALQRVAVHGSVPMQLLWQPSLVAGGAQSE